MRPRLFRRGSSLLETALWTPLLILFFMGTVEFTRATYSYYTLKKVLYNLARYVGTQQGVNFCAESDPTIEAAKLMALTGNADGSGDRLLPGLEPEQITIRIERYTPETGTLAECSCDGTSSGCDASQGARGPDYIVTSVPGGWEFPIRLGGIISEPITFRAQVKLPFGGY
jgi:hypothetical protein